MKSLWNIIFVCVLANAALAQSGGTTEAQSDNDLSWLNGGWAGVGYQAPTNTHWDIELSYDAGRNKFKINYPTLNCSGKWEVKSIEPNKVQLTEYIQKGKSNCDNVVQVVVTHISAEYISVAYFLPNLYDGVVAYAVLRRKVGKA